MKPFATEPGENRWKTACFSFFYNAGSILTCIILLNLAVNPKGLYPARLVPQLIVNDMKDKKHLFDAAEPRPKALVFGSSRSMMFRPALIKQLTGLDAFNAGISSGAPEDIVFMLRYSIHNLQPRLVIIGLDVEMFHNGDVVEQTWQRDGNRIAQLLGMEQTALSVQLLRLLWSGHQPVPARHLDDDGYLHYDNYEAEMRTGHYDLRPKIAQTISEYTLRWKGYTQVSEPRLKYLEEALRLCKERGIDVRVVLTPYHPEVYASLPHRQFQERRQELRARLMTLCRQYAARCYDYTLVGAFHGENDEFYDGVHMTPKNTDALVTAMLTSKGSDAIQ